MLGWLVGTCCHPEVPSRVNVVTCMSEPFPCCGIREGLAGWLGKRFSSAAGHQTLLVWTTGTFLGENRVNCMVFRPSP